MGAFRRTTGGGSSGGGAVTSVAGRTGVVVLANTDISGLGTASTHPATDFDAAGLASTEQTRAQTAEALLAPLANAALTGTPTVPTAAPGTNTTQAASTAFVAAVKALLLTLTGGTLSGALAMGANKITGLANGSVGTDAAAFGQIPTAGSAIPVPTVAGSAGSASTFMRSDAVPLREYWTPGDFGFAAWSYPCDFAASSGAAAMVSGTVYVSQVNLVATTTISKAYLDVQTIGSGLTASQSFVGLFDPSNALIGFAHVNSGATELSTDFTSTGLKTITLAANGTGLTSLAPGKYRVGVFQVGTTPAQFKATISATGILNGLLSAANSKYASADAGRTTSFASPLGTLTGYTSSFWVAIS